MQSSPPHSNSKAHTLRELSRSLSHSPRNIPSPSPPPSDSNPTKHSGFGTETSSFFNNPDILMSTQHKLDDITDTLPQYPRIRSTAKKINTWHMPRSEQPVPDTSLVNKQFNDFDHSFSDEEVESVEQARGGSRSNRGTPSKMSSHFNSLYDITPPTNRTRKSYAAEGGSLRRDAQLRRASRNDHDFASPRPSSKRNSPALSEHQGRKPTSLAQVHAKLSADESSFMDQRPPTLTIDSTKNTRWGNRSRQTSLQVDGATDSAPAAKSQSKSVQAHNTTALSFVLPDLPNLTELVSGVFEDGTPVFSKTAPIRTRFATGPNGKRRPQQYVPIKDVPIPTEEKAIFAALQQLQDKVAQMEQEREESAKRLEDQDLELIELRATVQAQDKLHSNDAALYSTSERSNWKIEKTKLDATVQSLRTKVDRAERKIAVLEIEKKRSSNERDDVAAQLSVAFQTCEELKSEKSALAAENDTLREEVDILRAENESLRQRLDQEYTQHREETIQLRRQFDQSANATEQKNATLHAELARIRAQHDDHTQRLARQNAELHKARQEQADYDRLQKEHESLRAQLAELKSTRQQEVQRWSRQESLLRAQVDHRDETIRNFQEQTQEETNEAMRLDNENLRQELAQLSEQHKYDNEQWAKKEADMKRKIQRRDQAVRKYSDEANEPSGSNETRGQRDLAKETHQHRSNYQRDDTRTRIKNRVEQELHASREAPRTTDDYAEGLRRVHSGTTSSSKRRSLLTRSYPHRSSSAPLVAPKQAQVESDVESTTDLSLAPRARPDTASPATTKSAPVQLPVDLDLTELSYIDGAQIARLRRALEEERASLRRRSLAEQNEQNGATIASQKQAEDFTSRSVTSTKNHRQSDLTRKSSMKENTQRTNMTQFEEDATGEPRKLDAAADTTQSKQLAADLSILSNTSRRRRSAHTEMTSAFILPDIKLQNHTITNRDVTSTLADRVAGREHDNSNCTVCRREGLVTNTTDSLRVPKLVPVSSRMPDDVDATLRPARSPKEALALVVKELQDERAHLHMELAITRAMLESHDVSLGNHRRREINASIQTILRRLEIKDTQIYNLYDVLEGQKDEELTELDVENITEQIRAEDEETQTFAGKKGKKVTIQSFVDDDSVEIGRAATGVMDDFTEELPWEGFDESGVDVM